ncbi:nuclear transport factor 2 family protein [Streptomyces sp. NPDC002896]|uniref:ester cyclase n=1 Tax=Streptomyces sp. NPDC002896 TaxID=3154438 RepID=UPI0033192C31
MRAPVMSSTTSKPDPVGAPDAYGPNEGGEVRAEQTFRAYIEAFNRSDVSGLAALYAADAVFLNPFSPEPLTTRDAIRAFISPMFEAYSDMTAEVDELLADADRAAARLTIRARHTGELRRPGGAVAATGRTVEMRTAEFLRVEPGGLIVGHERIFDTSPVLAQLGLDTG